MRFRFSLKWLLIDFTALSVIFYVLFIRPTVIANRLITSVGNYDLRELSKATDPAWKQSTKGQVMSGSQFAELEPANWSDIWNCQRRVVLKLSFARMSGNLVVLTAKRELNVTTGPAGIRLLEEVERR